MSDAQDNEAQAISWVVRLDAEGHTPALLAEIDHWLAQDRRREGALLRAQAAWVMLDEKLIASEDREAEGKAEGGIPFGATRRWILGSGLVAAAGSIAAGWAFLLSPTRLNTGLGEIRRVPLKDGSVAQINTQSAIDVSISDTERRIRLAEGEAWFEVAKDARRPFVVEAGNVRARAVGTAFSVRRRGSGVNVVVTEGVVDVWIDGAGSPVQRFAAGDQASVGEDELIVSSSFEPGQAERALAWRSGKIDLAGETLSDAVAEFNRYNKRRIEIADASLADERLFGLFRIDDPEGFARAVQSSLGTPVLESADTIVIGASVS